MFFAIAVILFLSLTNLGQKVRVHSNSNFGNRKPLQCMTLELVSVYTKIAIDIVSTIAIIFHYVHRNPNCKQWEQNPFL